MSLGRKFGSVGGVVVAGLLASATPAWAVTIGGIDLPDSGAVFKVTQIWEQPVDLDPLTPAPSTLSGIGMVSQITSTSCGGICWSDGQNGVELTFTFTYELERIVDLGGGFASAWFSGGDITFYSDPAQDFTFGAGASEAADIDSADGGAEWLNLIGAETGIVCGAGECASGAGTEITLSSLFSFTGDLAAVNNGFGSGFLDVLLAGSGLANSYFDQNNQPSGQDILLTSSFAKALDSPNWEIEGTANLRTVVVPEPGTLALLGAGLLGLAWARRRRSVRA